jgi:hypothetical protein
MWHEEDYLYIFTGFARAIGRSRRGILQLWFNVYHSAGNDNKRTRDDCCRCYPELRLLTRNSYRIGGDPGYLDE